MAMNMFSVVRSRAQVFLKPYIRISGLISFIFLALCIALPIWQLLPEIRSQGAIPLHYNIYFGVDWYGVWWKVFTVPFIGGLLILINTIFTLLYVQKDFTLICILWTETALCEFILLIAMTFIILLNLTYI